jgi:hypothetical protein
MAKLKEDGESTVEGSIKMWFPLDPDEGESLTVKSGQDIVPLQVWLHVNLDAKEWSVGSVIVKGRILKKDDTPGERWAERDYWGPHDDGHFEGPKWLAEIIDREVPRRLSSRTMATDAAKDHSYEANMAKVAERIAELEAALQPSPQRVQFDSALRVLLMRENLDGTEWAIRQLREGSDAARRVAEETTELRLDKDLMWMTLGVAADELEKLLDKRAAELATKEH